MQFSATFLLLALATATTGCTAFSDGGTTDPDDELGVVEQGLYNYNSCGAWTSYTLSTSCGAGVYAGPTQPWKHGGVCLYTGSQCRLVGHQVLSFTGCANDETYVGPARPDIHGGTCLRDLNGTGLHSAPTTTKACPNAGIYAGPNKPEMHGGYCLYID